MIQQWMPGPKCRIIMVQLCASVSLCFCCAMVSGQMWNYIRGPALFEIGRDGRPVYISGHWRKQLAYESYIVAALNGAVAVSMILAIEAAGGVKIADGRVTRACRPRGFKWRRRGLALLGTLLVCYCFSYIIDMFKNKRVYPYAFLI